MKKFITAATVAASSFAANASFVKLETNFGMMKEFDTPQMVQQGPYPTEINPDIEYKASCGSPYNPCSNKYRFFGFKFALTDTFIWNDGGYIYKFSDALPDSFYINAFAGGGEYSYLVEDTDERWLFGSFYNKNPTPEPFSTIYFSLASEGVEYGNFVFDLNRTAFYAGNTPLALVPEPETFTLFILGAVGVCVRRQIKANTTLPV